MDDGFLAAIRNWKIFGRVNGMERGGGGGDGGWMEQTTRLFIIRGNR